MNPLRVTAFTQGDSVPSARFRVRQYVPMLAEAGIEVRESPARFGSYPAGEGLARLPWLASSLCERSLAALSASSADVVLFQREMVSTLYSAERLCRKPAVLDVDDAIWLTQRWHGIDKLARQCRLVLCGNDYIASYFRPFAKVRVIPTGVDTSVWKPGITSESPIVVWSGSSGGLLYLLELESVLLRVLGAVPHARLRVVCNEAPRFKVLSPDRVEFVQWSPEAEVAAVQSATVGLMPMPDNDWARGKCSFKMLTYLACGVPAVASPWGMNQQVIQGGGAIGAVSEKEWFDAITSLLKDRKAARAMGAEGREQVDVRYASSVLAPRIAEALREVAGI